MKSIACVLGFLLLSLTCSAQYASGSFPGFHRIPASDTLAPDHKSDSVKPHSIRTAVWLSAALPGAGQVYNHIAMPKGKKKAFWKVPLIYAGLGATGYFLVNNQSNVRSLRNEYDYMTANNGAHSDGSEWIGYDQSGILTLHDQYQTWRDLSILGVCLVYILQVTDAGVEAHFVNFDVSHDLSLQLDPVLLQRGTPGMSLTFKFR